MDTRAAIADALAPLRPIYDGWMRVVAGLSWLIIRFGLVALYVTVFVVYGVVLRLTGTDPLDREMNDDGSFWQRQERGNDEIEDFRKLY